MSKIIQDILSWIKTDYNSYPFRFIIEFLAWLISIGNALIMAFTVPDVPLLILYPLWVAGCSMYAWAAWTRKSFGMLANYLLLTAIDITALIRLLA